MLINGHLHLLLLSLSPALAEVFHELLELFPLSLIQDSILTKGVTTDGIVVLSELVRLLLVLWPLSLVPLFVKLLEVSL